MKSLSGTTKIKAVERQFHVALLVMLCEVVLTVEFVDEILKCGHSN